MNRPHVVSSAATSPSGGPPADARNAGESGPGRWSQATAAIDSQVGDDPIIPTSGGPEAERFCVLVVDDEEVIRESCRKVLEQCGHTVELARDGLEALSVIRLKRVDLVLLDLRMPRLDGMDLLRRIREETPHLDVIVITGYSSVGSAVDCMRLGAYDYLPKPFTADALRLAVHRALEKRRLALENRELRQRLEGDDPPEVLHGGSRAVRRIRETVRRVAPTDATVLILGESGTGKELVARAIHRASQRREGPFVPVDCGAVADSLWSSELFGHVRGAFTGAVASRRGRFEQAKGGTIFLDEIGNIDPNLQGKLLRALQEREITRVGENTPIPIDVRVIAATNQDLRSALIQGLFREDLYYRLSVVTIEIPPLRDRREDIPVLANRLLARTCRRRQLREMSLGQEALAALLSHDWPGNVRELANILERALLLARDKEVRIGDLEFFETAGVWPDGGTLLSAPSSAVSRPGAAGAGPPEGEGDPGTSDSAAAGTGGEPDLSLGAVERAHIERVLERTGWRLGRTARLLGIDRKTLWRKLRSHGIERGA